MLKKTLSLDSAQFKAADPADDGMVRFEGYASVFGGKDAYGDTVMRGAYEYSLRKNGKPKMFFNHEMFDVPIGKWTTVTEDDKGLFVKGELTPGVGDKIAAALKHGTVDGISIGYFLKSGDWEDMADGGRIIKRVSNLVEISPVTFPADDAARVDAVKSQIELLDTERAIESFVRDAGGLTRAEAKAFVARCRSVFAARDAGDDESGVEIGKLATRIAALASMKVAF